MNTLDTLNAILQGGLDRADAARKRGNTEQSVEALAASAQEFLRRSGPQPVECSLSEFIDGTNHLPMSPSFTGLSATLQQYLATLEELHDRLRNELSISPHRNAHNAFEQVMHALLRLLQMSTSYDVQLIRGLEPDNQPSTSFHSHSQSVGVVGRVRAAQRGALDLLRAVPAISRLAFNEAVAGHEGMAIVHEVYIALLDALTGQPGAAPATQLPHDMQRELSRQLSASGSGGLLDLNTVGGSNGGSSADAATGTIAAGPAHAGQVLALIRSPSTMASIPRFGTDPFRTANEDTGLADDRPSCPVWYGSAGDVGTLVPGSSTWAGCVAGQAHERGSEQEEDPHELATAALLQAASLPLNARGCANMQDALRRRPCMVLLRMLLRLKERKGMVVQGGSSAAAAGAAETPVVAV